MAETKCQFDLLQRVIVPNGEDITGVIVGRNESIEAPPMYSLQWTGLNGRTQYGTFAEAEVWLFNQPREKVQPAIAAAIDRIVENHAGVMANSRLLRSAKLKPSRKSKNRRKK